MVLAISSATDLARHVRASGEEFSYIYPEKPPERQMRGPTPILDYLSPVNDNFHALPHVTDPLEEVEASGVKIYRCSSGKPDPLSYLSIF